MFLRPRANVARWEAVHGDSSRMSLLPIQAASVSPSVWVYQINDDGIAAEVSVKGTKHSRDKGLG